MIRLPAARAAVGRQVDLDLLPKDAIGDAVAGAGAVRLNGRRCAAPETAARNMAVGQSERRDDDAVKLPD